MTIRLRTIDSAPRPGGTETPPQPYDMAGLKERFARLSKSKRKLGIADLYVQNNTAPEIAKLTGLTQDYIEAQIRLIYAYFLIGSREQLQDIWKLVRDNP